MNLSQIEKNLSKLIKNLNEETFIYDLLLAYNLPKATRKEDYLPHRLRRYCYMVLELY